MCGCKHFHFGQKYHTHPQASAAHWYPVLPSAADAFSDASACIYGRVHIVHVYGRIRTQTYAHMRRRGGVRECVHSTSVCIHRRIHENVLARTALLPGLSAPLPTTLPSVRWKGAREKLAVTLAPRTSSGPIRQLKLNVCALSASSNSYKGLQQSECY